VARILVIDDEQEIRSVLRDTLSRDGHEVVTAADGREGVALYRDLRPELVITDIAMPRRNGLDVIAELVGGGDVKLIAMSGWGGEVLDGALDMGAFRSLEKPFSQLELLATVNEAIAN